MKHEITLRDYFAANAPPMPEWWIKGKKPNREREGHDKANAYKHAFETDQNSYASLVPPARLKFEAQWRYEYADAMIAANEFK